MAIGDPAVIGLEELAARVPDGAVVAIDSDRTGAPIAAALAMIQHGVKDLHLVPVPTGGLVVDLLVGAGAVATVEAGAITLSEYGLAPRFGRAVSAGTIRMRDSTCPAVYAGLEAAERGVPFLPMRGLIGSDVLANRDDWMVIDNPFGADGANAADPLVLVPAIKPDVAIIHARMADRAGNIWFGRHREVLLAAHAARRTLVTVERIVEDDLISDDRTMAGTLPAMYVYAIAVVERGASPIALDFEYEEDADFMKRYVKAARDQDGFDAMVAELSARILPAARVAAE